MVDMPSTNPVTDVESKIVKALWADPAIQRVRAVQQVSMCSHSLPCE
jgi:hypothetical protein